jgi:protoheme IX farnesyltransferase
MSELTTTNVAHTSARAGRGLLGHYSTLTKARLSLLVLWTTAVGFVLAAESIGILDGMLMLWTLLGTALAAGSANTFNQILEIDADARMVRTKQRPLPAGDLSRRHALLLATILGVGGVALLALLVNTLAAGLALLTILIYVLIYTPMKQRTSLNTLVGAVCGAIPPMIGWAGAAGTLDAGAWVLGGILFIWQLPHFLALAWLYREDYERGGYAMLPHVDRTGAMTCRIVVLTSLMLIPLGLTATLLGLAGWIYTAGSIALGLWMFRLGVRLQATRADVDARRVFLASIIYLATILVLLVADRGTVHPRHPGHLPTIASPAGPPATAVAHAS